LTKFLWNKRIHFNLEFQFLASGRPGLQPPRQYGFAPPPMVTQVGFGGMSQPAKTGIPRPGSRIPGPRTVSGIPKPGGNYIKSNITYL